MLYQITSSYFVAGIVIEKNSVTKAAPIVAWMIGKNLGYIQTYCNKKKWTLNLLTHG